MSYPAGAIICHSQVVSGSYLLGYPGDCNVTFSPGLTSMGDLLHVARSIEWNNVSNKIFT